MKTWIIPTITLLVIGAAGFGAGWAVNEWQDGDGGTDSVSAAFCQGAADWQSGQKPFQLRVDERGSRDGDGLEETFDVFYEAAKVILPAARSETEQDIHSVLRQTVRAEEEWLSELHTLNVVVLEGTHATPLEVIDSHRKAEAKRLESNDLLREANALLEDTCGLPPLPIYGD